MEAVSILLKIMITVKYPSDNFRLNQKNSSKHGSRYLEITSLLIITKLTS